MYKHTTLILALLFTATATMAQEPASILGFSSVTKQFEETTSPQSLRLIARILVDSDEFRILGSIRAKAEALSRIRTKATSLGVGPIRKIGNTGLVVFEATQEQFNQFVDSANFLSVQVDEPEPTNLDSVVPFVKADQLHAHDPDARGSWTIVAILDTGVDTSHDFIKSRIYDEACFSTTGSESISLCQNGADTDSGPGSARHCTTNSSCEHGTHVAGIVASSNQLFKGIAPETQILPIQVFSKVTSTTTCNKFHASTPCILSYRSNQLEALDWLLSKVLMGTTRSELLAINMSLGGGQYETCRQDPRAETVRQLRNHKIAVVISSGNSSYADHVGAPACISEAIAVGAVCDTDFGGANRCVSGKGTIARFSNSGDLVDLLAPGVHVTSSVPPPRQGSSSTGTKSGTSMAAPVVAGGIAALQSYIRVDVDEIERVLEEGGNDTRTLNPNRLRPTVDYNGALEKLKLLPPPFGEHVWMRDTWSDTGREPEPATLDMAMYKSPDIWIRNSASIRNWCHDHHHSHQNPIAGQVNYGCVKIGNRGPTEASGSLDIYGAKSNLNSAMSWGEPIVTIQANLAPLRSAVLPFTWNVVDRGHYCLLARWRPHFDNSKLDWDNGISDAVRGSNNLIWKNVTIVDGVANFQSKFLVDSGDDGQINLVVDIKSLTAAETEYLGDLVLRLDGDPEDLTEEPTSKYFQHDGQWIRIPLTPGVYYIPNIYVKDASEHEVEFDLSNTFRDEKRNKTGEPVMVVNIMSVGNIEEFKKGGTLDEAGIQYEIVAP